MSAIYQSLPFNRKVETGDKIAVWFSCGAASAVAAKRTVEMYGDKCSISVVYNPVNEEDQDNIRFMRDVSKWIGLDIETATNKDHPECSAREIWKKWRYMSGVAGAPCTNQLKKKARQQWESQNRVDWHVLGFTADESARHKRFVTTERENVIPVLIDLGIKKSECFEILKNAGIAIPRIYGLGYKNANCIGCVKSSSPAYWNLVRKTHPEIFQDRAAQSREIGCKLATVKGKRVFLDELPIDAGGGRMPNDRVQCGSFCEERAI